MAAADNVYTELKTVLEDFEKFLNDNHATIKAAIGPLRALIGDRLTTLLDKLIDLLNKLEAEIKKLDVKSIPGLDQAAAFTDKVKAFLVAAEKLLPDEAATIDEVTKAADVVSGLPSIDQVRDDIDKAIESIVALLTDLKAA